MISISAIGNLVYAFYKSKKQISYDDIKEFLENHTQEVDEYMKNHTQEVDEYMVQRNLNEFYKHHKQEIIECKDFSKFIKKHSLELEPILVETSNLLEGAEEINNPDAIKQFLRNKKNMFPSIQQNFNQEEQKESMRNNKNLLDLNQQQNKLTL